MSASLPERNPQGPAPGEAIPSHYRECYGCGMDHETGLHMRMTAQEGLVVVGEFVVTDHHQGAPGLAHGGVLAAAMDEVIGATNWLLGVPAVTATLACEYRKPVPVGVTLYMQAEIVAVEGRKVSIRANARLGSPEGPVAVDATALFVQVPIEHFTTNGAPANVAAALQDRAEGGPAWRPGKESSMEVNP